VRSTDAGGPVISALATGLGAAGGGVLAAWLGYLYAAAFLPDREFVAIPIIVFGGFGGGIAGGALACWLALLVARRREASGTALRALAFLFMAAPVLLFATPALDLDRVGGVLLAGIVAALLGAVARLLTPDR
jgi:hypothetical protein